MLIIMRRKKASEIFGPVDPNLNVINASHRPPKRKPMTIRDWDNAAGVECPKCNEETLRIVNGLCPRCANREEAERVENQEVETMRRYYAQELRNGTISLSKMKRNRY